LPILSLLLVNLVLGLWLAPHYGQSTDEEANLIFARATLESYSHPQQPYRDPARDDKGPFYLMVWLAAGERLGEVIPGWMFADGRHFVNFLAFQMALVSIFALALRFVRPWVALAGVVLFETQPVFFGHAFINQKDIPFMGFFAAAIVMGIYLVDRFPRDGKRASQVEQEGTPRSSSLDILRRGWFGDRRRARRVVTLAGGLALFVPTLRLVLNNQLHTGLEQTIQAAYQGQSWAPINELFLRIAENAATLAPEAYVLRASRLTDLATVCASILMVFVATAIAGMFWPEAQRRFWPTVAAELREGTRLPIPWLVVPSAIVLGMGIAVRSMTLFAGGLVILYAFARRGPRIAVLLALYFALAGFTAYLLWPQLWGSPLSVVSSSLDRSVQFPQPHRTLFEGVVLLSNDMPPTYLPEVMAIQLTLPALLLILAGGALAVKSAVQGGAMPMLGWVLFLWSFVPFVGVVGFGVPIYNYFRHVLFIMPPLFVAAAYAMERGWQLLPRRRWVGLFLTAAIVLPGIWAIARLHPYEYGYFNELVGGVRGAYKRFIPDYWCTSLREAMEYVNAHAPPSAGIAVTGPLASASAFAREDLRVRDDSEMASTSEFEPWAILACNLETVNPGYFPDAPVLWTVERDGTPLAVVKRLGPAGPLESP
jgi:hypothetical protein